MSETVCIETSILGYLTARPSRELVVVADIEMTELWGRAAVLSSSTSPKQLLKKLYRAISDRTLAQQYLTAQGQAVVYANEINGIVARLYSLTDADRVIIEGRDR